MCGEQHLAKHLPKLNARKTCCRFGQGNKGADQSDPHLCYCLIYLWKKKRNKRFDSLLAYNVMSVFCANDVNSWEWYMYVTVKLWKVQCIYQLRMHVALTSFTSTLNIALDAYNFFSVWIYIQYKDVYSIIMIKDLQTSKKSIMASKFVILHFNGFHKDYALF